MLTMIINTRKYILSMIKKKKNVQLFLLNTHQQLFVYFPGSTGLLSCEHGFFVSGYVEDICPVALSDPLQTLNPNTLSLLFIPYFSHFHTIVYR